MPLNHAKVRDLLGTRTVTSLARELKCQRVNVYRFFKAGSNPELATIEKLAKALGVTAKDLIV